jgi:hypothetical protein
MKKLFLALAFAANVPHAHALIGFEGLRERPMKETITGIGAGALGANRESQLAAECAMLKEPSSIGACIAGRLTTNEVQKCKNGIGTSNGCFGPNNSLRKALENALSDVTKGPGESNDLVGREGYTCKHIGLCF